MIPQLVAHVNIGLPLSGSRADFKRGFGIRLLTETIAVPPLTKETGLIYDENVPEKYAASGSAIKIATGGRLAIINNHNQV